MGGKRQGKKQKKPTRKKKTTPLRVTAPPGTAAPPPEPVDADAAANKSQERMLEVKQGNTDLVMIELLATVNKNLCVLQQQLAKLIDHVVHED